VDSDWMARMRQRRSACVVEVMDREERILVMCCVYCAMWMVEDRMNMDMDIAMNLNLSFVMKTNNCTELSMPEWNCNFREWQTD